MSWWGPSTAPTAVFHDPRIDYFHKNTAPSVGLKTFSKKVGDGEYILHTAVTNPIAARYVQEAYVAILSVHGDADTSHVYYEGGYASLRYAFNISRSVRFSGPAEIQMGMRTAESDQAYFCVGLEAVK